MLEQIQTNIVDTKSSLVEEERLLVEVSDGHQKKLMEKAKLKARVDKLSGVDK